MRVLCINTDGLTGKFGFKLEEGKVYEPLEHGLSPIRKAPGYLIHVNEKYQFWYAHDRFIPLSDLDETIIHKDSLTQITHV